MEELLRKEIEKEFMEKQLKHSFYAKHDLVKSVGETWTEEMKNYLETPNKNHSKWCELVDRYYNDTTDNEFISALFYLPALNLNGKEYLNYIYEEIVG